MGSLDVLKKDSAFTLGLLREKPFQVLVQVTNRCNMQCSFCEFWSNPAPRQEELTTDDFRRVADELSELGTFLVSLEGGEPFVRPDLVEIVRAFGRKHIPALFTNGWMVTRDNARALFDAGLVHASVSIDYPDAARHDRKRGLAGATDRAWRAVDTFLAAAPRGGRQVHVISVLMEDNWRDIEALFARTAALGVGHQITLLSDKGFRRQRLGPDRLPPPEAGALLTTLWPRYPHVRMLRSYFEGIEPFLAGAPMPTCHAGEQSFNLDHVGGVAPCIERIDQAIGNVKTERLPALLERLRAAREEVSRCQDCWTLCRGFTQALGGRPSVRTLAEMTSRMRTV